MGEGPSAFEVEDMSPKVGTRSLIPSPKCGYRYVWALAGPTGVVSFTEVSCVGRRSLGFFGRP